MTMNDKIISELMKDYKSPEDLIGENGLLKQLTKALLEKALEGEMTHQLGYAKHDTSGINTGNSRNGKSKKKLIGDFGQMDLAIPRDRNAEFEPQIVKKGQRRFDGFDDKIISMYARGMTTREIQGHLKEIYGVDVSPELISTVTDAVIDEVKQWQSRPLDPLYTIVYLDAIFIKIREEGHVQNQAVYLAIGVNLDGIKEVLGLWIAKTEGAKFWLQVITEIKNRGVEDILIACVDGLKGFPEAIESVFPKTQIQACIVHTIRNSLKYVSWKKKKEVATDLKTIYKAKTLDEAQSALDAFENKWQEDYPIIAESWRRNWERITPFFAYPQDIRKAIYTTNAIESLNMSLRKVTKNRGSFPNKEAVFKLLYLALRNITKKWTMPIRNWGKAMNQFVIIFGDRVKF